MNTKLTVKAENGRVLYCILNKDEDIISQLETVSYVHGGGLSVRIVEDEIRVMDYYHDDVVGFFTVLSREDTEEKVSLKWTEISETFITEKVYYGICLTKYAGTCETVEVLRG